jgi:fructose-bisphosphate aldolase, class I
MNIGKQVRLNRLFSHPSGRLCAVAVDHFFNYGAETVPDGLRRIGRTLEAIVAGRPDSVTMHRGIAASAWQPFAGKVPFILQSSIVRYDDSCEEQLADPEDAVRLGADAFAVAAFVRGPTEGRHLRVVADCVKAAARWEMPVVTHIYPRTFEGGIRISFDPRDIAWAVRCALECGSDVIKVPYCNDVKAYAQIVAECPVPLVAAGGPKTKTMEDALAMLQAVVKSGARGAVVGRNVWSSPQIARTIAAMKAVVHDGKTPQQALALLRAPQGRSQGRR